MKEKISLLEQIRIKSITTPIQPISSGLMFTGSTNSFLTQENNFLILQEDGSLLKIE